MGFDWIIYTYPALLAFVTGMDPYAAVPGFVNPPWMLALLSPLALLPPLAGAIVLDAIALTGLVALCRKAGRTWLALPLAVAFPMATLLWHGQVDGLVLWGLALGGPVGLFLLSTKPQVAGLVGLVWLVRAWRQGRWRQATILILPTAVVALVFTWLYPSWLSEFSTAATRTYTTNGFPWTLPVGAAALVAALRHDREDWAALATVFLAPYVNVQSWMGALALFAIQYPVEGMAAALGSWLAPIWILGRR
jgi:hypothetical protein